MKLGMILDAPFPDDARVSNECDELIKSGHEIFLFCLSYKKKFQKIEVYNGINIKVAKEFKISREDQDVFSFNSHMKAIQAIKNGKFDSQIVPITSIDNIYQL